MKKATRSAGLTSVDLINAETSTALKDAKGKTIEVRAVAITEEVSEDTGEVQEYVYLFATDGEIYGSNSGTVLRSASALIDLMADTKQSYKVTVIARMGNNDREFLTIRVAE